MLYCRSLEVICVYVCMYIYIYIKYTHTRCIKKQGHRIANKDTYSQSYCFFSSHARMWELDHNEGWALKNWCFWSVVLEKTLESPLDSKEIKSVNPKGNQPWIFIGRTDAEAEASTLWPSVLQFMGVSKSQTQLRNWTKTRIFRGRDIPLIWEVQESLGNWGGIWVVPQNFCRVRVCADERNGSIHDQRGRKQKKEEGKSMRGQTRKYR